MIKKAVFTILFLSFITPIFSQNEINAYKYILVPKKYDFLKEENQYRVNSYTRYLFNKEGYNVFYIGDPYPSDLDNNICLGLEAIVVDHSSSFTTKIVITLVNCKGQTVFETVEGRSKIKDYNRTYVDALKKCFVSIQALNYSYEPSNLSGTVPTGKQEASKAQSTAVPAAAAVAVPVAAVNEKEVDKTIESPAVETATTTQSDKAPIAVVAAPVVVEKTENAPLGTSEDAPVVAKSYQNENITFILVNQGAQLQAYVTKSNNDNYKAGEMVGTFEKTSLPNVFRVSWKKPEKDVDQTTAYFDEQGNLKIDVHRNGVVEVVTFKEVK